MIHMGDIGSGKAQPKLSISHPLMDGKEYIAVVGMSCKVPGAENLQDFWDLLCENKSQHKEVPNDRFTFDTTWRETDPNRKWFGNFIDEPEAFDHKFFRKSPREAAAMDPQQKLMLQAAYQAVEQSGYFRNSSTRKHIGCYIGVSNVDYQDNVACHAANAFTATGTLMSFVAGKVSHYFGWTGPAMSIDTACSGSAVAIHEACKSILNGDCEAALAGGVNAITSPLWFQNLAGASFLSQTGQCKPFDEKGDGYCRAEAVGAVYLKRLSRAVEDGDLIFGTIAATAVQQNQNSTAITVPNSESLSNLFTSVTSRARIDPLSISVVEAHGTGTAVGDPAEYASIRQVLGGEKRTTKLALRSVKGLIGHAECASGIIALIKTLLMIHESTIAPQASYTTINPALHASASDNIEISAQIKPWKTDFKAALINNYGASGSNASMVITEYPRTLPTFVESNSYSTQEPFWLCGADEKSLLEYVSKLLAFLKSATFASKDCTLSDMSFNLARQSNRSLSHALIFQASSIQNLGETLEDLAQSKDAAIKISSSPSPVILCFGGQVSTFVGLDRQVFERARVFRNHLDECNSICKSMDLVGIYPEIFQRTPIADVIQLQTTLFAIQYASAKSWIDCGLQVAAVVGHSFGEIVAQTVAGALSLRDGLKVIARRAQLIRDTWGSDKGCMMAIEGDLAVVENLLARANEIDPCDRPVAIACYNGPRSFTLGGSSHAMQGIEKLLHMDQYFGAAVRFKKLNTSHAFHSTLVESLIPDLKNITHDIKFSESSIPVEKATMLSCNQPLSSSYFAEHLRQPVYFDHAVKRLAKIHQNAIWVEAGSQSTVTNMAAKALGAPKSSHFQAMNITSNDSWQRLTEATIALWKQGLNVSFWSHHSVQALEHAPLILPPYQFEKSKHFVELKQPQQQLVRKELTEELPKGLWAFIGYQDAQKNSARFRVETGHEKFQELMAGHTVAHSQPLCPSTLQLDIATEAIKSLCPEYTMVDFQMDLRDLENPSPICRDASRVVWLDVAAADDSHRTWSWRMVSNPSNSEIGESLHAAGRVLFRSRADADFAGEFRRFERLVSHKRCQDVLESTDADDILQGRAIYKLFADVVDYSEVFRGVHKVVGKAGESAGRVIKRYSGETWLDTPLCDSFCQVAGVFVNCMTQRPDTDAFISSGVERVVRSPFVRDFEENPDTFDVLALHHRPTDRSYSSDVFIFNSHTSQLFGVILGIQYQRVSKLGMAKLLTRLTPGAEDPHPSSIEFVQKETSKLHNKIQVPICQPLSSVPEQSSVSKVKAKILALLCEMIGIEEHKISDQTSLIDLGIDSLMGMEVARELEILFQCTLDVSSMMSITEFRDLVKWVGSALGNAPQHIDDVSADIDPSSGSDHSSGSTTPSTAPSSIECFQNSPQKPSEAHSFPRPVGPRLRSDVTDRQLAVELYVSRYCNDFSFPSPDYKNFRSIKDCGHCVLITGATGSLGTHLVEHFANLSSVRTVICFNRPSNTDALVRQRQALEGKRIFLADDAFRKLQVIASDMSKPLLGLSSEAYGSLVDSVTDIVHNAWPMSITRSISDFEKQFVAMRNLIDLARDASYKLLAGTKFGFQFVSSIATVGLLPVVTGQSVAHEKPSEIQYALRSGYSDAKLVCERMVARTLSLHPEYVNAMVVRVGQVAGSRTTGFWNPAEHFSLLVKSASTLNALPNLPGHLSWLPVNDVAATLAELALSSTSTSHIYHVENPSRQPWSDMIALLAIELKIPPKNIIPYQDWLDRVKKCPSHKDAENPAKKVMDFLENHFLRMACGGLILDTEEATAISKTLKSAQPVQADLAAMYVRGWKNIGFL